MASSSTQKVWRITSVIKNATGTAAVSGPGSRGFHSVNQKFEVSPIRRLCKHETGPSCMSCLGRRRFQDLKSEQIRRSSWLSNSIVFIKGSGDDGGGKDPPSRSSSRRSNKELGETSILRQEGHNIEEVPVAVIKTDSSQKPRKGPPRTYIDLNPTEEAAFIEGFGKIHTPQQVLKMLDTIPSQEVTPFVSFSILKKLFELENNFGFRNEGQSWLHVAENATTETFARLAIVTRLVDTILTCEDNNLLLDALDLLRRECPHVNDQSYEIYDPENHLDYRNKLLHEVLIRVTEGKLGLEQVCRAVIILGKMEIDKGYSFSKDYIDKFWVGVLDHSDDITSENIVDVLRTVKYFKKSSRLVLNLLERKMFTLWWKLDTKTVAEICSIFTSDDGPDLSVAAKSVQGINSWQVSVRLLMTLSKCVYLNIHKVTEAELSKIVKAFNILNFCDSTIQQAVNKYMKAKCLKITDAQLVSNISDYARKFRLRTGILEATAEFVVRHEASNLSPPQFSSIVKPFGELDFQPPQGPKFWGIVEAFLNEKFIQLPPNDIIEILLSCIYLKKYPINFVDRIFSPYFLDRLHTSEADFLILQEHRSSLKLLDIAMTIECKNKYAGPLLPKDFSSRSIFTDGRILRMTSILKEMLLGICSDSAIDTSIILPGLPFHSVFTADVLITTPKIESDSERHSYLRSHINSSLHYTIPPASQRIHDLTIILVNIPEHFSSDNKYLLGIQSTRSRLLKSLGFKVVNMRLQTLIDAKGDYNVLKRYIETKLDQGSAPLGESK